MSASFVAGFFMTVLTLLFAIHHQWGAMSGDAVIDFLVYASIAANIVFFYGFGTVAEENKAFKDFLAERKNTEWPLRVLSNVTLLGVPASLDWFGPAAFIGALLLFYLTLIFWDIAAFGHREPAGPDVKYPDNPTSLDMCGLVAWALLSTGLGSYYVQTHPKAAEHLPVNLVANLSTNIPMFMIGGAFVVYLLIAGLAVKKVKQHIVEAWKNRH